MPQKTLKVVPAPLAIDAVPTAPPAPEDRIPTVDYMCGSCDADENKVHSLIIHCTVCDACKQPRWRALRRWTLANWLAGSPGDRSTSETASTVRKPASSSTRALGHASAPPGRRQRAGAWSRTTCRVTSWPGGSGHSSKEKDPGRLGVGQGLSPMGEGVCCCRIGRSRIIPDRLEIAASGLLFFALGSNPTSQAY
jgi:hypothetical protein